MGHKMINKNDIITLEITDISHEGAGIGHFNGVTIFVNGAITGDEIEAVIIKAKKNYCIGKMRKIIKASPVRVAPPCPIAEKCGGCQIQQMDYSAQLTYKEGIVRENLIRLGGFDRAFIENLMEPIVGMDNPFRYRNKAQVPVQYNGNEIVMGYYGNRSHRIIPMDDCLIGQEKNKDILNVVRKYMNDYDVMAYDEETGKGLIRHVLIREAMGTGEVMVCLVVNGTSLPYADELCARLGGLFGGVSGGAGKNVVASVCLNVNTRRDNVILGDKTKCIYGLPYITDTITVCGREIKYQISANSFYQVNHDQMEKLYSLAVEYAGLTGNENVWDLYCGIGTISLAMAGSAKSVYGVEIVPQAIDNAIENAKINGFENCTFEVGAVEDTIKKVYDSGIVLGDDEHTGAIMRPDVVCVDPPRKGCDEVCLNTILSLAPERIVYVSCDSATLARDLKILCANDYKLERVRAVDQFCHSGHVETVCLLSKKP